MRKFIKKVLKIMFIVICVLLSVEMMDALLHVLKECKLQL